MVSALRVRVALGLWKAAGSSKMAVSPPWAATIFEPGFVGGAGFEDFVGELCAGFGGGGMAGEVEHPAGEDVGEVDEVGGAGWRCCFMMSTHSQTSTQLPEKRPRGSSMVVRRATVRVPARFAGLDHEVGEVFGVFVFGMKAPLPVLTSRTRALRSSASFLLMMLAVMRLGDSMVLVWSRRA